MKKVLVVLLMLATVGFASVPQASADVQYQQRIVSYLQCGRPVYAVYQIYGYDAFRRPIGRWVIQQRYCGCHICNPRPVYQVPQYGPHYPQYTPPCNPVVPGRSGWMFFFNR
jgi:hypothetical protein